MFASVGEEMEGRVKEWWRDLSSKHTSFLVCMGGRGWGCV